MKYKQIVQGRFLERENRFVAYVEINGKQEKVHVKNTGRCKELLTDYATVFLEKSENLSRTTAYDLVTVMKGNRLINMDSQAPNKAVEEWLKTKALFPDLVFLQPEKKYKNSRFDFYIETTKEKIFLEVKGVTLEKDNVVSFPDAPSERAIKHMEELIEATKDGYKAYILFVVQLKNVNYFIPNAKTQPAFATTLIKAKQAGVNVLAYDCEVKKDEMNIKDEVKVCFTNLDLIQEPLLAWYEENKRGLPWRDNPMPYHVWVSEIMLQQTRVEAVKPYFKRFIEELPDIKSLANAKEDVLLKLWEGLGYYNRVRNMQIAAKEMVEKYDGKMPLDYEKLLLLKGIGSYTAGAVASIAFGKAVPVVDGNVLRVVTRILKDSDDIGKEKTKQKVWNLLNDMIPKKRAGDFNQAIMELGATICIPNGAPLCMKCPVAPFCGAYEDDCTDKFPVKTAKKERKIEKKTILVIEDNTKIVLQKRPNKGLLAGMYQFPMLEGNVSKKKVLAYLKENGVNLVRIVPLNFAKHIFTHKEWHMIGYGIKVDGVEPVCESGWNKDWLFIEKKIAKEQYPIPSAFVEYTNYLSQI